MWIVFCSSVITGGGELGSKCRPRKESSRLQMSPLPKNMTPVTNQNARGSYTHTQAKWVHYRPKNNHYCKNALIINVLPYTYSYSVLWIRQCHTAAILSTWTCKLANLYTSSNEDIRFMPKATPIKPNKEREKVPMVSWRFRRIITFRWLVQI